MKRFFPSLLLLIMACCNVNAQDADFVEHLMFKPGNSATVKFPGGTRMRLYNYSSVGADLEADNIPASDCLRMEVVFHENLESDLIKLQYYYTKTDKATSSYIGKGQKKYSYNIANSHKTAGNKIWKFGIYYANNINSTDPKNPNRGPAANLAIDSLYLIKENGDTLKYTEFSTFTTYGLDVHQSSGQVIFQNKYAAFDITDEQLSPLSYKTTDGETNIYRITFAEDLYDKIEFRLKPNSSIDGRPKYVILPSTSEEAGGTKLLPDGEGGYYFEHEVTTDELTAGNAVRVYVACCGNKNLANPDDPDDNTYSEPWSLNIKSITRKGREAVTIKNVVDIDEGWTTYCNTKRLEYSRKEDMEAYIVTARNATTGALRLQQVNIVPGNSDGEGVTTPVILKIPKMNGISSVTFGIPSTTNPADNVSANMLQPVVDEDGFTVTDDGYTYYALANKASHGVGFYKVRPGVTIPKGRAYLCVANDVNNAEASAREFLGFDEGGSEFTDITSIVTEVPTKGDSAIYDLMGCRVQKTQRGHLYIKNGKKFIAK